MSGERCRGCMGVKTAPCQSLAKVNIIIEKTYDREYFFNSRGIVANFSPTGLLPKFGNMVRWLLTIVVIVALQMLIFTAAELQIRQNGVDWGIIQSAPSCAGSSSKMENYKQVNSSISPMRRRAEHV